MFGDKDASDDVLIERLVREDPAALESILAELGSRVFVPHSGGQLDVMESPARFRILSAGRRWGKTKLAAHEVIKAATSAPNQMVWWVANEYKNVARGYREVLRQLPPSLLAKPAPAYTSNNLYLQFANGSVIEFYSGGNPDALAGEGLNFIVVDEGGLIKDQVWNQLIRPTLADKMGRALIISTPRGRNWFWNIFNRGQDEHAFEYQSWRFPSSSSPYVLDSEIEAIKDELPELIFRQEFLAEFLAAGASIFGRGVETPGAIYEELVAPYGDVFMGIDLAKQNDFTVITASRGVDRAPCYFERFNELSWPMQRGRIHSAANSILEIPGVTSLTILQDSTGVGDVVHDDLVEEGLDVIPVTFTNQWKHMAVSLLASDMEQGRAHIYSDALPEFESYELSITPAGNFKYEAAVGHDDTVSAKLLEHWGLVHEGPVQITMLDMRNLPPAETVSEEVELMTARTMTSADMDSPAAIMERPDAWG